MSRRPTEKLSSHQQAIMDVLREAGIKGASISDLYDAYLVNVGPENVTDAQINADPRKQQQIVGAIISRIHQKRPGLHIKPGTARHTYVLGRRKVA